MSRYTSRFEKDMQDFTKTRVCLPSLTSYPENEENYPSQKTPVHQPRLKTTPRTLRINFQHPQTSSRALREQFQQNQIPHLQNPSPKTHQNPALPNPQPAQR